MQMAKPAGHSAKKGKMLAHKYHKVNFNEPCLSWNYNIQRHNFNKGQLRKTKRVVRPKEEWIVRHNTHPPLITPEEYNQITDIIENRKKKFCREWTKEKKYLLSGILYCSVCKGKIYGGRQTTPDKSKGFYYYVDQNRYGLCNTKTKYWNMEKVDNAVLAEIKKFFEDKNLIKKIIKEKYMLRNKNISEKHIKQLKTNLHSINTAIKKQQEAYEKDVISIEEYGIRMKQLRKEKKRSYQQN